MAYKVGDVVLLKVKVTEVDARDKRLPYRGELNGGVETWFHGDDVAAVIPQAEAPAPPPEPLKVGDFVRRENGKVTAQVLKTGEALVIILLPSGDTAPARMSELTRADKPADWPF